MDSASSTAFLTILVIGWLGLAIFLVWWFALRPKLRGAKPGRAKNVASPSVGEAVLLAIEVPQENEKTPLAAETLFSSLHAIGASSLSFEIEAKEKSVRFYVWVPAHLRGYVESQLYAQYPDVNVLEAKDYSRPDKVPRDLAVAAAEVVLNKKDFYPIKTFINFDVDPLSAITGALSKLQENEHVWIQVLVKPEDDKWRNQAVNFISAVKEGRPTQWAGTLTKSLTSLAGDVVRTAVQGGYEESKPKKVELSPGMDMVLKSVEEKSSKLGFRTKIRVVVLDQGVEAANSKLQLAVGAFRQFNTNNLNAFVVGKTSTDRDKVLSNYTARSFEAPGFILNVTELASIYHLPNVSVTTPNIVWAGSKKGEPPANLPLVEDVPAEELTVLAKTNFRGSDEKFGIKLKDRARHVYIIGKSGTGKTTLVKNMAIDDIRERRGVAIIDPHGDYVDDVLEYVPSYRVNDVIVFDPGDQEHPVGINILEVSDPKYKVVTASSVVGAFKKIFGNSWGPRLEYWLSSAVMALLDYPDATLMMIPRLFTDDKFREKVIDKIDDPLIKARWIKEYNTLDQRQRNETISPILNKVGQFLSSSVIRNIVGQPHSSFDFRKTMDDGKIILVKLAKGLIGEDNASLLGAMIVTKIQLAAMSRADIPEAERRDFYLYVDEFQNFATDSFAVILSEARKYRLSLTLVNQYMDQLSPEVQDAIFGNVGTLLTFRVGGDDAMVLKKEFAPVFDENDLVNLNVFHIYAKLSIDGLTTKAFSAQTLPPPADKNMNRDKIVAISRERYAKDIEFVSARIDESLKVSEADMRRPDSRSFGGPKPQGGKPPWNKPAGGSQNRSVPFKPGARDQRVFDKLKQQSPVQPKPQPKPAREKPKPQGSLLKKVISAIEGRQPWTPPQPQKPNPITDLSANKSVEEIRRQRSDEAQKKAGDWMPIDELKDDSGDE